MLKDKSDEEVESIKGRLLLLVKKKLIKESVSLAKAKWYADVCSKIHDMDFNPKRAGNTSEY